MAQRLSDSLSNWPVRVVLLEFPDCTILLRMGCLGLVLTREYNRVFWTSLSDLGATIAHPFERKKPNPALLGPRQSFFSSTINEGFVAMMGSMHHPVGPRHTGLRLA